MRRILSCEFNLDTACVELVMKDGALLTIDCTAVENEVTNSMYQRSELPRDVVAEQAYDINRLKMENKLLRDFLQLTGRK